MNVTEMNELVAFALAANDKKTLEDWQDSIDIRTHYRKAATELQDTLTKSGVRISVSKSSLAREALVYIRTWQPRPAYDLMKESPAPVLDVPAE